MRTNHRPWSRLFSLNGLMIALTLCATAFATQAATPWPDYISRLIPVPAESPEPAVLPADVTVDKARSSGAHADLAGIWRGWACRGWFCDIAVAIESVTGNSAQVVYSRAYKGSPSRSDRVTGEFVDGELRAPIPNGTTLVLRPRGAKASGILEMVLLNKQGKLQVAGVVTNKPFPYSRKLERIPTPWSDGSGQVTLETIVYQPTGVGPYPTLIFHHGSTGSGNDPKRFKWTWVQPDIARFFTARGYQVLLPQRRGRGDSGGEYGEGLAADGSGYACEAGVSVAGADRAIEDAEVITQHVLQRADVDKNKLLLGGLSRGGVVAVAHGAKHPAKFKGIINFAGGWMGDQCAVVADINPVLFARGAGGAPSLWIYGDRDPYYSLAHSRGNFAAFEKAGGNGEFLTFDPPSWTDGHSLFALPRIWTSQMDAFMKRVGAL